MGITEILDRAIKAEASDIFLYILRRNDGISADLCRFFD